jgi:NTE family protein
MTLKLFSAPKKIGLALGSGAARGLAHIGVLKVLAQEQIPIAAVSGTSIGALIGALYAAGVPVSEMEEIAKSVDWKKIARWVDPRVPVSGLIDGKRITRFFEELLPVRNFSDLNIPLAMLATDVETGESIVLKQGDLLTALRASIAFPGIFSPVNIGDRFLVDGGLCHPVPAHILSTLGATAVIGVCAIPKVDKSDQEAFLPAPTTKPDMGTKSLIKKLKSETIETLWQDIFGNRRDETGHATGKERKPPHIFRVFAQSVAIMENQINDLRLEQNNIDVLIRPDLAGINLLDFNRAAEVIEVGAQATRKHLDAIRSL